jgi:hypothetical protein
LPTIRVELSGGIWSVQSPIFHLSALGYQSPIDYEGYWKLQSSMKSKKQHGLNVSFETAASSSHSRLAKKLSAIASLSKNMIV